MGTQREEVQIAMGIDNSAVARGMAQFSSTVKSAVTSVGHHIEEVFSHVGLTFGVGGGIALFHSMAEQVKDIKRISESTGVGTGMVQDMMNLAKASGLAGESIEKALDFFVKGLPSGSDPETALLNLADSMAKLEDPTERARLATEAFGKSGVKLIPILKDGADGVKRLASEYGKLTEAEIDALEHADRKLEQLWNKFKIQFVKESTDKPNVSWLAAFLGIGDNSKPLPLPPAKRKTVVQEEQQTAAEIDEVRKYNLRKVVEANKKIESEVARHKAALKAILGDNKHALASVNPLMFAGDVAGIEKIQANIAAANSAGRGDLAFSYGLDLQRAMQSLRDKFNAQIPGKSERDVLANKLEELLGPTVNQDGSINIYVKGGGE